MSKYGNKPTLINGIRFASKLEAGRYQELKLLERAGEIGQLTVHPRFQLFVGGYRICTYVADFSYTDKCGTVHIEDTKGVRTAQFILKKKLMWACLGLKVEELRDRKRKAWEGILAR